MQHLKAITHADRMEVMRVAHAAFGNKQPFTVYAARAYHSMLRRGADWWLTRRDGEVVASLLCYTFDLAFQDQRVPAFGLGSVGVLPAHHREGLASALCNHVAASMHRPGVLFSAVPPKVYERMGYQSLPAFEHVATDLEGMIASGPGAALTPIDAQRHVDHLAAAWDRHAWRGWRIDRDANRWASILQDADTFWFEAPGGYVSAYLDDDILEITEVLSSDVPGVLRACASLAVGLGKPKLKGWFEPSAFVQTWFTDAGRAKTLPMVRELPAPASAWFSPLDYF